MEATGDLKPLNAVADAKGRERQWSRHSGMTFFELFARLGLVISGALGVWSGAQGPRPR